MEIRENGESTKAKLHICDYVSMKSEKKNVK